MNQKELNEILDNHKKWLFGEEGGIRADLRGANLRGVDLRGADLHWADLRRADLRGANLSLADLRRADLREASLKGANLMVADLREANLMDADLMDTDLREADLSWASLCGSSLIRANLMVAKLSGADLSLADLSRADLREAILNGAKNTDKCHWNIMTTFFPLQCPESGSFIGWKIANGYIVKLRITENAKRSSATSRKCRCSEAEVLAIENKDGSNSGISFTCSDYDKNFVYRIGETVRVDNFDENRWNECAPGIHFFITRDEAVKYV